jgi:phosphatidylserine/phosphatidylglycerophosphate/cardiolipin synthase-like enzyme
MKPSLWCSFVMMTLVSIMMMVMVNAECNIWFSPNGGVKNETVRSLTSASSTIEVAIYSFSDSTLLSTLITRAQAGVAVRVVMNQPSQQKTTARKLIAAGIPVRYINVIMHHKFALVDCGKSITSPSCVLLSGSQNWSPTADAMYDEDFQRWQNVPSKAASFQSEFELMWAHSRIYNVTMTHHDNDDNNNSNNDHGVDYLEPVMESAPINGWKMGAPSSNMATRNVTMFTSANFEPYLSHDQWSWRPIVRNDSEGAAGAAILELIGRARRTLRIATTHLRRTDFADALANAVRRGVMVTLVLDQQEAVNDSVAVSLVKQGVDLRFKTYMRTWTAPRAQQMHAKFVIADDNEVLTGSFNWSDNSGIYLLPCYLLMR